MNTWFLLRNVSWPIIELGIVVFATLAAWRYKLKGLWVLAAASILGIVSDVLRTVVSVEFLSRHNYSLNYLALIGFGYYAAMVIALFGWGMLAFSQRKRKDTDG
jgi:hypothetical protein